ncbi:MAG: HAD-IIB family hydrolase [Myxococcota bacterium]
MKHYRELDPSDVRGVIFDIDDTVTKCGILEADAFAALHMMRQRGLSLVAVTGRPLGWVDVIARMWPVSLAVGENGAGWRWMEGAHAKEGYFDDLATRAEQKEMLSRIATAVTEAMPHVKLANDRGARRCDLAFDVGEEEALAAEDVDRLVAIIEAHGALSSVSTVHAHATPGQWDKAQGVRRAIDEALGVDVDAELDRWVFVGDSGNDAAAFSYFPVSVGVSNVRAHLHRLPTEPRYVTDGARGAGFSELAAHLCEGRA